MAGSVKKLLPKTPTPFFKSNIEFSHPELIGVKDLPSKVARSGFLPDASTGREISTGNEACVLQQNNYGKGVIV